MSNKRKFHARGKRLQEYYLTHWKKTQAEFAEALGVRGDELCEYFTGTKDPIAHAKNLIKIGIDLHWLITGEYLTGLYESNAARLLKRFGVNDCYDLWQLLSAKEKCSSCGNRDAERDHCIHNIQSICLN